jgi:DNA modification methylase
MFWFSMKYYQQTVEIFSTFGFKLSQEAPLIWHKTDNRGILADPTRRPRHIYETALMLSRGGRLIKEPVGDCYGAPSSKQYHQSEKPVPMLGHFLRMFLDKDSEIFDPTVGAGSSILAAEALGVERVLGLDIEPANVEIANERILNARKLRL